jgi:CRISPR system Cascade subunit CasA
MNGGFGNRPLVTLSPDLSWSGSFRRDLEVLRQRREQASDSAEESGLEDESGLEEESGLYASEDGHALLWELPWDGSKDSALSLSALDPHFIEVCRRIRLLESPSTGDITCWRATTKGQRVDVPSSLNGRLEDPWIPVNTEEGKALTVGSSGFQYDQVASIFFEGTYEAPDALQLTAEDVQTDQAYLLARTLVRGQGKTKGLKRRLIPIPQPDLVSENQQALSNRAEGLLQKCSDVTSSLLYPAVSQYAFGEDGPGEGESVSPLISSYSQAVNENFFSLLFGSLQKTEESAHRVWDEALLSYADSAFEEALNKAPVSSSRHWGRLSNARDTYQTLARRVLPAAFE